jgi:hypothetical protein
VFVRKADSTFGRERICNKDIHRYQPTRLKMYPNRQPHQKQFVLLPGFVFVREHSSLL